MSVRANDVLVRYSAVFSFVCGRAPVRHFRNDDSIGLFHITITVAVAGKKKTYSLKNGHVTNGCGHERNSIYIHIHLFHLSSVPIWLVSSVNRALHRFRRGHGFESRTSLNFVSDLIFAAISVS